MLKKSSKALASCYYALSYGLLSGMMLWTNAYAESSNTELATPSVSEAAVHALSQSTERSAQGQASSVTSSNAEDEEAGQSLSLLDAVHDSQHYVAKQDGIGSSTIITNNSSSYETATQATAQNQSRKSAISPSSEADLQSETQESKDINTTQVLYNTEQSQAQSEQTTSQAHSALAEQEQKSSQLQDTNTQDHKSNVGSASSAEGKSEDALSVTQHAEQATADTVVGSSSSEGRPLESAGQNKFGALRSGQNQGQGKGPLAEGLTSPAGILQWMASTVGVLLLIFVLAYIFRKSRFIQKSVGTMQVESQIALGQKERLMRVKVGERSLLLGVTANNINLIMDLGITGADKNSQERSASENLKIKAEHSEEAIDNTQYSAAYKLAQEAYNRKQYEDILVSLSQVAASAAASAAISAVQGSLGGYPAKGGVSVQSGGGGQRPFSQRDTESKSSVDQAQGEIQGAFTETDVDVAGYKADQSVASQDSEQASTEMKIESAPKYVKEPFKAIVEPHANEAHHIANHFSSEHTIVRASNSTPFMGAQFGLPPDKEVLHARAQRSKQYAKELADENRPRLSSKEQAVESDLEPQGQYFGEYLDSAIHDLSKSKGASTMVETEPWTAEDDLAQELERNTYKR